MGHTRRNCRSPCRDDGGNRSGRSSSRGGRGRGGRRGGGHGRGPPTAAAAGDTGNDNPPANPPANQQPLAGASAAGNAQPPVRRLAFAAVASHHRAQKNRLSDNDPDGRIHCHDEVTVKILAPYMYSYCVESCKEGVALVLESISTMVT
ncbi:MAG: hypothetical protein BJ554DRAFT_7789 [Olpidium bornovanus]|uniref:Uncharacterized protein n=1 Tax=Olpidium bornovanus TaxID=278681 RepID=A0A8H8DIT9_9FUNG|nr:MAG: hypothetical protein BJ554DRAFT_7789 [Olpidium bornovanus]